MTQPADADIAYAAGMAAIDTGREEDALRQVEAARAASPDDPRLWNVSALLHRAMGDLAGAVPCSERAAALWPSDFGIAHLRARVALEAGLPAAELYENVLPLAEGETARRDAVQLGLIEAVEAESGAAAAAERLDAIVALDPGWLEGHAYLARLRVVAGEGDRVTASFERALTVMPRDLYLWRELIVTLLHAERYEEALGAVRRARTMAGGHAFFDANEAVAFDELGDHVRAEQLFAPLAHVDEIDFLVRRARNALRLRRPEEASALLAPRLGESAPLVGPYLASAWRLLGDPRLDWLEGDARLVGVYDLPEIAGLAERLRGLHRASEAPLDQSLRGGTQTPGDLLRRIDPEIQALRRLFVEAVAGHIARLPPPDPMHPTLGVRRDAPIRFPGAWSVRLAGGGHHVNHMHPAGWLSSAYYVAVPEDAKGEEGWLKLGEPPAELGLDLAPTRLIEPRPGRLILFPSTMWHGTIPFAAGERLTVAFDVARPGP